MLVPHRLSLGTIRRDYWRSLRKYGNGRRDWYSAIIIFGLPVVLGFVAIGTRFVISAPVALLPAASLLAGVLLAAAGQVVTMRARIADSLTLADDERVSAHIRETMSGILLGAVAALIDALLLGALATILVAEHRWWHVALTGGIVSVTTYLALTFVATARRLYTTFLEVFEGGSPLPRRVASATTERQRLAGRSF